MTYIAQIFTNQFFGFIGFFVILALPYFLKTFNSADRQTAVTTAGMLGTFVGIVGGLFLFDVNNISASVPALLGGLKTAFLTSVAGLSASLILQWKPELYKSASQVGVPEEKTEQDILGEMLVELKSLNKNMVGDEDSTLLTQLQKLRTSLVDKHDELKKAFDEFAKQMAENNMRALIEAVNKVMEDFNAKINDQLGENFKRLSEGVEGLLVWQDQYKQQISDSTVALQESSKAVAESQKTIGEIADHVKEFDRVSKELKETLEAMGSSITGIKALADTLQGSGKQIRDEMEEITKQNLQDLGEKLKAISEALVRDYEYVQKAINQIRNVHNAK